MAAAEPIAGNPAYLAILEELRSLHIKKAQDYGTETDSLANIRASEEIGIAAWRGAWLRGKDKVKRIDAFCRRGTLANEGVEDSLKDLAAYCLIALVLFRESQNVASHPSNPDPVAGGTLAGELLTSK